MEKYMEKLRLYLQLQSRCCMSVSNKTGSVFDYVQCTFAYHSGRLCGGSLSEDNIASMYRDGAIYATRANEAFTTEEIIDTDAHFHTIQRVMDDMDDELNIDYISRIYEMLHPRYQIHVRPELLELSKSRPHTLYEIAEFHSRWMEYTLDEKTGRIIVFLQCLQNNICPFIIHEENKFEYESRITEPERLEQLFRMEQKRFYRETEPMAIFQK